MSEKEKEERRGYCLERIEGREHKYQKANDSEFVLFSHEVFKPYN
jgi:hypothetical protein